MGFSITNDLLYKGLELSFFAVPNRSTLALAEV